jgi:hypothetical protein
LVEKCSAGEMGMTQQAWNYVRLNEAEIEREIAENEAA